MYIYMYKKCHQKQFLDYIKAFDTTFSFHIHIIYFFLRAPFLLLIALWLYKAVVLDLLAVHHIYCTALQRPVLQTRSWSLEYTGELWSKFPPLADKVEKAGDSKLV